MLVGGCRGGSHAPHLDVPWRPPAVMPYAGSRVDTRIECMHLQGTRIAPRDSDSLEIRSDGFPGGRVRGSTDVCGRPHA